MLRIVAHGLWVIFLTLLTQIGGLAWLIALPLKYRAGVFVTAYIAMTLMTLWVAPLFGRVPLNCFEKGPLQVQSVMYCALNRNYVAPDLKAVLEDAAGALDAQYPGTTTLVLDANFPFFDGFPLLPHLSHDDGDKVDTAFYYQKDGTYLPGKTRSPFGYFAFEPGPTNCPKNWLTLRWDLELLQPLWRDYAVDGLRLSAMLKILASDPRVGKVLIEPHIKYALRLNHPKLRFQGCRAARHDDHIHVQL
ncbi:MAG: hypothetical protein AAF393_07725 [Pseudomonadota bacterium]